MCMLNLCNQYQENCLLFTWRGYVTLLEFKYRIVRTLGLSVFGKMGHTE